MYIWCYNSPYRTKCQFHLSLGDVPVLKRRFTSIISLSLPVFSFAQCSFCIIVSISVMLVTYFMTFQEFHYHNTLTGDIKNYLSTMASKFVLYDTMSVDFLAFICCFQFVCIFVLQFSPTCLCFYAIYSCLQSVCIFVLFTVVSKLCIFVLSTVVSNLFVFLCYQQLCPIFFLIILCAVYSCLQSVFLCCLQLSPKCIFVLSTVVSNLYFCAIYSCLQSVCIFVLSTVVSNLFVFLCCLQLSPVCLYFCAV